jgi:hypothetical protein
MTLGECARSFATQNGGELEQIQFLLDHASILTTERYLGCKQNLEESGERSLRLPVLEDSGFAVRLLSPYEI